MGRKDKVTESTSTLQSQPADGPEFETAVGSSGSGQALELVEEPGPVKKIVFEGSPEPVQEAFEESASAEPAEDGEYRRATPEARPARPSALRDADSIRTIHSEVDELRAPDAGFAGVPRRANLQPWRTTTTSKTVYRTDRGGEVRSYEGPTGRSLTLSDGREERRFSESEVDRVIEGVDLAQAPEPAQEADAPVLQEAPKRKRGLFGFIGRKAKPRSAAEVPEGPAETPADSPSESEYQPQCGALTEEGLQCRNSARGGSKYCSSHFGFQPRTVQGIHQARDTEPRFESSKDTLPGGGWEPGQGSAQCTAVTKGNKQCQNPVIAGTSHCGSHQGYQEPGHKEIVKSVDTKPRWSGAKDTKPSTRKAAKPARKSTSAKGKRKK